MGNDGVCGTIMGTEVQTGIPASQWGLGMLEYKASIRPMYIRPKAISQRYHIALYGAVSMLGSKEFPSIRWGRCKELSSSGFEELGAAVQSLKKSHFARRVQCVRPQLKTCRTLGTLILNVWPTMNHPIWTKVSLIWDGSTHMWRMGRQSVWFWFVTGQTIDVSTFAIPVVQANLNHLAKPISTVVGVWCFAGWILTWFLRSQDLVSLVM